MSAKKIDWDFRFIMGVMACSILFGIWLCFQAYPEESRTALGLTARIGLGVASVAAGFLAIVRYRRWKREELAKETAPRKR
jgi:hypothetical protein